MIARDTLLDNRYRVLELLGTGAMGSVYLALDERLSSYVAVKITIFKRFRLAPEQEQELRRAFEREAKLLANLQHDAIPRVADYFSENDEQHLVMEFIPGEDLFEQAEKKRRNNENFELETVVDWTLQLLDGLEYLHTQPEPVIHKDIKLSNLKVTNRGRIKLLDFGISKGYAGEMTRVDAGSLQMGTEEYAPLEQFLRFPSKAADTLRQALSIKHAAKVEEILNQKTDARSDLYSLAVTVYRLLTGKPPADYLPRALKVWEGQPDPLVPVHELNKRVPAKLSNVLMRALALEKAARPTSAAEMRADFIHAWREHLNPTVADSQVKNEQVQNLVHDYEEHLRREITRRETAESELAQREREILRLTKRVQEITTTTGLQKAVNAQIIGQQSGSQSLPNAPVNGNEKNNSLLAKLFGKKYLALILLGLIVVSGVAFTRRLNSGGNVAAIADTGQLDDAELRAQLNAGKTLLERKDFDGAISVFSTLVQTNPNSAEIFAQRGEAYRRKGDFEFALEDFNRALERDSANTLAIVNRADIYCREKKDFDRAFVDFDRIAKIKETDFLYEKRGYCFETQEKYDEALADYNTALRLDPDEPSTYFRRGVIYLRRSESEKAAKDFSQVVKLEPTNWWAYANRAVAYRALGKKQLARDDEQKSEEVKKQTQK